MLSASYWLAPFTVSELVSLISISALFFRPKTGAGPYQDAPLSTSQNGVEGGEK